MFQLSSFHDMYLGSKLLGDWKDISQRSLNQLFKQMHIYMTIGSSNESPRIPRPPLGEVMWHKTPRRIRRVHLLTRKATKQQNNVTDSDWLELLKLSVCHNHWWKTFVVTRKRNKVSECQRALSLTSNQHGKWEIEVGNQSLFSAIVNAILCIRQKNVAIWLNTQYGLKHIRSIGNQNLSFCKMIPLTK